MSKKPFISVCLATYNRYQQLADCLRALCAQDYPISKYEIILVEDGSHSGAEELVDELRKRKGCPEIKYFWQENRGPAGARNRAIKEARGEIIAFTDDDTVAPPNWLSSLADGFSRHPDVVAVGGVQEETSEELARNRYARYESWITRHFYGAGDKEIKGGFETPTGGTNNIAYKREILDKVGVFDEYFGIVAPGVVISGEDPDLKKRVVQAGGKFLYLPIKVTHKRHFTLRGLAKQSWTRGLGIIHFAKKHPDEPLPSRASLYWQLLKLPLATVKAVFSLPDKTLVFPQLIDRFFTIKGQLDYSRVVERRAPFPLLVVLTSLLFACLYGFFYKFYAWRAPADWRWTGGVGGDDSVYLGLMQFVVRQPWREILQATNPWHLATDPGSPMMLLTPQFSSPYWFYLLGVLAKLFGVAPAKMMALTRILLGFLLPVSVWALLATLARIFRKGLFWQRLSFLFYHFAFGLGGLVFLLFSLAKESRFNLIPFWPFTAMGNAVTYELFEGVGLHPLDFLGRTYYLASLILGFFSLKLFFRLLFRKKKEAFSLRFGIWGGALLALSQTVYPITGVGFVLLAFLAGATFRREHCRKKALLLLKGGISPKSLLSSHLPIIAFFLFGALGGLPWFASLLADKTHFVAYGMLKVTATPLPLFVSTAPLLLLAVLSSGILGMKAGRPSRLFFLLLALGAGLLSVPLFPYRTLLVYFAGVALALLSYFFWRPDRQADLFFWLWFLAMFFASIMPIRRWTPFLPARFLLLLWLPLSLLSASFFANWAKTHWARLALGLVFLLGAPSAFFYTTWFLRKPLQPLRYQQQQGDGGEGLRPEYLSVNELEALQFLQTQPRGVVLSAYRLGMYLPLLSSQRSVLGRDPLVYSFQEKLDFSRKFFSGEMSPRQAEALLDKYQVSCILFGEGEPFSAGGFRFLTAGDVWEKRSFGGVTLLCRRLPKRRLAKVCSWRQKCPLAEFPLPE